MDKKFLHSARGSAKDQLERNLLTVFKFRAPNCKFSRAERFSPRRLSIGGEFTTLPSSFGNGRKTSFGFGKRYEFKNPGGGSSPPCNTYSIPSCFDKITGGVQNNRSFNGANSPGNRERRSTCGDFGYSKNKTRYSTDFSNSFVSMERHSTPGPRRISIS